MFSLRKFQIYLMISTLLFVSVACNYARRFSSQQGEGAPQSTLTLGSGEDVPINPDGKLRLVLDETQVTSIISKELSSQGNPPLQDPHVSLRDGQMVLTGVVQQSGLNADMEMVMEVNVTDEGRPEVSLISATVGMFSLPQNMLDSLSSQIKSSFESTIDQRIDNFFIESITIGDGEMVIEGHAR